MFTRAIMTVHVMYVSYRSNDFVRTVASDFLRCTEMSLGAFSPELEKSAKPEDFPKVEAYHCL
jgi:hypothetical protein